MELPPPGRSPPATARDPQRRLRRGRLPPERRRAAAPRRRRRGTVPLVRLNVWSGSSSRVSVPKRRARPAARGSSSSLEPGRFFERRLDLHKDMVGVAPPEERVVEPRLAESLAASGAGKA